AITATATKRRTLAEIPSRATICVMARVKTEKLTIRPAITPSGRSLPPATDELNTTGTTGRIQGEKTVASPATNATTTKSSILCPFEQDALGDSLSDKYSIEPRVYRSVTASLR